MPSAIRSTTFNRLPSIAQQLRELVAIPSISSNIATLDHNNRPMLEQLATWLEDLGFTCELLPIPCQPEKANLLATLGTGSGGLVLAGHSDTVPFDENRWEQDPFTLKEADNRWYGLGATDMKGFFPVALAAASEFANQELSAPLMILATADEETSMSGARALVEQSRPQARYAVIGEPTGLRPIRAHKGILMESVRVQGISGHSSNPALGNNALDTMHQVLGELIDFRQSLQQRYQSDLFEVNTPTLNLGHIHGGDNPNRICGHCELHFDLRPLPGMNVKDLHAEIHQRLQAIEEQTGSPIATSSLAQPVPAFDQVAHSDLIQTAERLTGYKSETVAFATEAPFMQSLGMETVVLGPGSIDQAHQPNEFIDIAQIDPAINILKGLIKKYCADV